MAKGDIETKESKWFINVCGEKFLPLIVKTIQIITVRHHFLITLEKNCKPEYQCDKCW